MEEGVREMCGGRCANSHTELMFNEQENSPYS